MRRFTDSVLFLALFALDALAWLILDLTGGIEAADPGRIAPMTLGAVIVIACPALLVTGVLALARALTGAAPRRFYVWALGASVLGSVVAWAAGVTATAQGIEVGLSWMAWFFGIQAVACVVGLLIALTGGIERPAKRTAGSASEPEKTAEAPSSPAAVSETGPVGEDEATPAPQERPEPGLPDGAPGPDAPGDAARQAAPTWTEDRQA
ncbi:MAG: hypothetical protein LKI58_02090 [Actinomyces sp.]|jgi:hypothetical protein|nr:hypothetical protein [Actinomyces sp.]MCI1641225.1 hypothetical protein [Actinomyces sp.]MCI1692015.1 hypothetical protein [Actinomyces sp.]MCI1786846.1 hypothetical protein [Actinomyces sp.]MCI1829012.1 hypothetical protein [Actinomyces sp.]MCI1866905.1 hypothetical protein [Actinomyces sp.]